MRRGLALGAIVLFACGGEAPVVNTPKPVASVTPKPVTPSGARWFFPSPLTGVKDKIDLGDGSILLIGDQGRREVVKGENATDSQYLIPDSLIGAWKAGASQFVFMADSGDAYITHDPLGQFVIRKGPATDKVKAKMLMTGKAAAVTLMSDGRMLRTADNGTTWSPIEYTSTKLFGHIATMDMGHDGTGVIIHVPQRVFVTNDDGATWKPAKVPAMGIGRLTDDVDGGFYAVGYDRHYAKLQGDALVATNDSPKLLSTLAVTPSTPEAEEDVETTKFLAGDRVIEVTRKTDGDKKEQVRFRSTRLGDKPGAYATVKELTSRQGYDDHVSAYGQNIVALRTDGDADENTPTSTIVTSSDGGATWKEGPKLQGDSVVERESLAVGPKGWTFVPGLCGDFGDTHSCTAGKIRVANGATFEDLLFTQEFRPRRFAFDEAHDKVYVIGLTESGNPTVYESPLSANKFTPIAKPIKTSYHEHTRIAVTSDGTLHVFRIDTDKSVLMIERRDVTGKELPTMWLPKSIELDSGLSGLAIAGARGVIMNGDAFGWETADAGATWTRIAGNGASSPECSDGGCIANDAQRLGWDLPLQAGSQAQTVKADTTAPSEDEAVPDDPREDVAGAPPRMTIACKAGATGTKVPSVPSFDAVNEPKDVFWYLHEENAGKTTLTIGGKSGVRKETLIDTAPAAPKDVTRQTAQRSLTDGYAAVRYSKGPQTIDVELGAFSLETGRVIKTTLPKVPSFRVSSYGFTGEIQLVSGGLLYQSTDATPAFFIRDGGKIDRLALPPHASLAQAQHNGTAWMLFSTDSHNMARVAYSNDNGGKWDERAWLVSDATWPRAQLVRGAHPWISASIKEGSLLYNIGTPPADELPMPTVVDLKQIDGPCDPKAAYTQTTLRSTRGGSVVTTSIDFGDKKPATNMTISQRMTRITPAAGVCTSGYTFYGDHTRAMLHRDGTKMFGWVFRSGSNYREQTAYPLTCTVTQ
jgi:photosystem II stability/assembly factor-like uncharacterized protein